MCLLGLSVFASCSKPDATLFEDKSTLGKADKAGWTVTASSEELTGEGAINGRAALVVDGSISTYWNSKYTGVSNPYPHWLVIDMKKVNRLVTVDLTGRQNNANGMTKFKIEGSTDASNWINIGITPSNATGELVFVPATKTPQTFAVSSATAYQFIRITAIAGLDVNTHLAEVDVFIAK